MIKVATFDNIHLKFIAYAVKFKVVSRLVGEMLEQNSIFRLYEFTVTAAVKASLNLILSNWCTEVGGSLHCLTRKL